MTVTIVYISLQVIRGILSRQLSYVNMSQNLRHGFFYRRIQLHALGIDLRCCKLINAGTHQHLINPTYTALCKTLFRLI